MEPVLLDKKEQALLDQYYTLWKDGLDDSAICQRTGMTPIRLKRMMPFLLAHCRHMMKHETNSLLANGELPDAFKLTPARRQEFLDNMAAAGGDMATVCAAMSLPLPTLTEVWYKQDPSLQIEAEASTARANLLGVKCLMKKM